MASSSTTSLLFRLLLICIVLDILTRYFEKPPVKAMKKKEEKNKYENPLKDVDIDTSLDEDDDDNFVENKKKSRKKKSTNDTDAEEEEEKEKEKIKDKKHKNKKKKKEDDEENKDVLTIIYDKKSFKRYYENLKNEIMGNFTYLYVEEKEYPLPPNKKLFSKFTFFTQIGVSLLIFGGQKLRDKLTMIPGTVFDMIEKNKWIIMIGNFFGHQYLNKYLSTTGAFEVYYKDTLLYSKLSSNRLPTELDIHKQLKKYVKKNNKKSVKKDDDDDEDL